METLKKPKNETTAAGVAILKPEFILSSAGLGESRQDQQETDGEPQEKRSRTESSCKGRKRQRGQNKARGVPWHADPAASLCFLVSDVAEGKPWPERCGRENCKFQHDVAAFMASKEPDLGPTCPIYSTYGHCSWGACCRYGSTHLTEDGHNKIDETKFRVDRKPTSINLLDKEMQQNLRKFRYDFSVAETALAETRKRMSGDKCMSGTERSVDDVSAQDHIPVQNGKEEQQRIGPVADNIRLRPSEKKIIQWHDKLYLSPLTTLGNLPFRRICRSFGADITCGEMAMASSLLQGLNQEWALVRRHESETLFGVQLCGSNPMSMARCAQLVQETCEIDFVDINMGCPIDLIYQQGGGSGLMRRRPTFELMVRTMTDILEKPLTLKMRTGISSQKNIAHTLMPSLHELGVSMVTLHGRSREQRYTRTADWNYINECAKLAGEVPLFGNGDILSYRDYQLRREETNVAGVMIGRGALIKPWIFTEIKEKRHWDISSRERLDLLRTFVNNGLEHWGSDIKGVETTRRFLLEWLSFLHRYIPVGILEHPPQNINERPPAYQGRDELETLMASANCADWVTISEMLLGKVPSGFKFLPKHKANAWQ